MKNSFCRILLSSFRASSCKSKEEVRASVKSSMRTVGIDVDDMSRARETPAYLWRKEEKWHDNIVAWSEEMEKSAVAEKDEDEDQDVPLHTTEFRERHRERKNLIRLRSRINSTSAISSCFSSEDEANDDDECYEYEDNYEEVVDETNTMLSSLNLDEKKINQSFAVVKKSEDPVGDFRRSMAEMVAEKGIYGADDLEQLLHCFLSLNSSHHHDAIVSAFSDIWQALFPDGCPNFSYKD